LAASRAVEEAVALVSFHATLLSTRKSADFDAAGLAARIVAPLTGRDRGDGALVLRDALAGGDHGAATAVLAKKVKMMISIFQELVKMNIHTHYSTNDITDDLN
jgi:hypothetical protein